MGSLGRAADQVRESEPDIAFRFDGTIAVMGRTGLRYVAVIYGPKRSRCGLARSSCPMMATGMLVYMAIWEDLCIVLIGARN